HRREPGADRLMDELRADEVDVRVEPAGGDDLPLTGDHLRPGPDDHPRRHAGHEVGIAGLADADDAPLAEAEVGLHDAPVIDDHRVRDHHVEDAVGPGRARRLPHAIADHLAAAELRLLAGHGQIALDADEELGVGEPHAIAGRRTVEIRVLTTRQSQAHDRRSHAASLARACSLPAPSVSALSPKTRRAPAISTSLVPSGNVPSTCTSSIISGTPSMTSSRLRTDGPASISWETVFPSRMPSRISAVISARASGWLSLRPRARRRRATSAAVKIKSFSCSRAVRCIVGPPALVRRSTAR